MGEQITLTYTITVMDDSDQHDEPDANDEPNMTTQEVVITVTGTNDVPVATAGPDSVQVLIEDALTPSAGLTATGTSSVTDDDTSDVVTITGITVATFGLNADPSLVGVDLQGMLTANLVAVDGNTDDIAWSFDSGDFGFDYLDANEVLALIYTIELTDSQGATTTTDVEIGIVGANDGPTIADATTVAGAVTEPGDADVNANGVFTVSDLDTSDEVNITGVSVASAGVTTGVADDATLLGLFTVSSSPIVAVGANTGDVTWNFDLGAEPNVFDYLAEGEEAVLTYTVELADNDGITVTQDVTVTITGTNDEPVLTLDDGATRQLTETDDEQNAVGTATVVDADLNDTIAISTALATSTHTDDQGATVTAAPGQPDDVILDSYFDAAETPVDRMGGTTGDITWSFASDEPTEAFDYLDDGESLELVYTITATDLLGVTSEQVVTITIDGTNDGPVFTGGDDTGAATENEIEGGTSVTGTLDYTDLDFSDVNTASWTSVGTTLGSLTLVVNDDLNADAESIDWTYSVDPALIDNLQEGQELVESFEVTVFDDNGETDKDIVTVTITGSNDDPVFDLDSPIEGTATEDEVNATAFLPIETITGVSDVDTLDEVDLSLSALSDTINGATASSELIDEATLLSYVSVDPTDNVIDDASQSGDFSASFSVIPDADPGTNPFGALPFDFLSDGQELLVSYTLTATDSQGATDEIVVSTTITGVNDDFFLGFDSDFSGDVAEVAEGAF